MTTSAKLHHLARLRSELTRESHQTAVRELSTLGPAARPVPSAASLAQEQLEWWIFFHAAWPAEIVGTPFGFERVTPRPDGLDLHLAGSDTYLQWLASALLPTVHGEQLHGIPGLRLTRDRTGAPILLLAGTTAQVRLRGITAALWRQCVELARQDFTDAGHQPLWNAPTDTMTALEAEHAPWFHHTSAGPRPFRLASGLLRRIGLFSAAGATACLTGWTTAGAIHEGWKFDFEFIPGHRPDHDHLLRLLTDPDAGLPLRVAGRGCARCPGPDASCRIQLTPIDGLPGGITMLFHSTDEEVVQAWERRWPGEFARIRSGWNADCVRNR
ncbi:hypothetical protein AB0D10_41585 [Kitasatospora sp. NPDC048545]|uniref:hypothetical protein n=1 Tax=Kitasatospora sp. NPDC048545 TaxID=3157208 RepID=UPI0033EC35A3